MNDCRLTKWQKAIVTVLNIAWDIPEAKSAFLYDHGSHWLDHVYKNTEDLKKMMQAQMLNRKSVFLKSQKEMEQILFMEVLKEIQMDDFKKWLADPSIPETVYYSFQFKSKIPLGVTLFRRKDGSYGTAVEYTANIVLGKIPNKIIVEGVKLDYLFYVLTAYPRRPVTK